MSTLVYLDALAGAEPSGAFLEVRFKGSRGMRQAFFPLEQREHAAAFIGVQGERSDTYVGAAPRRARSGGRDAVEHVHVLWADCDSSESIEALEHFRPRPSIIVCSGSGRHVYWSLWPPVGPDDAERANRRLAHALGADMAATDAARILRPPGTRNFKRGRPVEVEHLVTGVYEARDVVGQLPDPPVPTRALSPAPRVDRDDPLLRVSPPVYVALLTGQEVPRSGSIRCPLPDHEDLSPSFRAYGDPADGWFCFGCARGGTVYDLAAALWGIPTRGRDFIELRARVAETLLGRAAA